MKRALAVLLTLAAASPAYAQWRLDEGVAIVEPGETNSNIELLALMCGEPFQLEVYARGGPVMPADQEVAADYFYKPGMVRATVDAQTFRLTAAGSDGAVVLFGEGSAAQNYMGPLPRPMIEALKGGKVFTLAFDITAAKNADGSPHETVATFPLTGSREAIEQALAGCSG
jgi:hypothetical protein